MLAAAAAVVASAPAVAQLPTLPTTPTTTTTRPTTTTQPTTTTAPDPGPAPTTTAPTTPPDASQEPAAPSTEPGAPADSTPAADGAVGPAPGLGLGPGTAAAAPAAGLGTPGVPTTVVPGRVPNVAQRTIGSVRRSGPSSTRRLLTALAPLEHLGMTQVEVMAIGFGRFPVAGPATFTHDWLFPRFTPEFHLHQGTDIFAASGTPVRAPADGSLKLAQGGAGGLAAYVYQADGTYYYMAHLSGFVKGLRSGQQVKLGEVVGFVGDTGNARGGSPHLHFEIHPAPTRAVTSGTGRNRTVTHVVRPVPVGTVLPAVDPKATLDQWLREALDRVPELVGLFESRPRVLVSTGITRRLAGGRASSFPGPVAPPLSQLLWATSSNPAGGAVRLAEAEAATAAQSFDWSAAARRQQAVLQEQAEAAEWAKAVLDPLTPASLRTTESADT